MCLHNQFLSFNFYRFSREHPNRFQDVDLSPPGAGGIVEMCFPPHKVK